MKVVITMLMYVALPVYAGILSTKDPSTIKISNGYLPVWYEDDSRAPKTSLWTDNALSKPLPTNAWWMNTVLGTSSSSVVTVEPYIVNVKSNKAGVFYGFLDTNTPSQMGVSWIDNMPISLGCVEDINRHGVDSWDDMGVIVKYTGSSGVMTLPLVRGMPFVTMKYKNLTPRFIVSVQTIKNITVWSNKGEVTFSETTLSAGSEFTGSKIELKFLETDSTWRFYSSEEVDIVYDGQYFDVKNQFSNGYFRMALVNNCTYGTQHWHCASKDRGRGSNTQHYTDLLEAHVGAVVTGGTVDYSVDQDQGKVTYKFNWVKENFNGDSSTLLMGAMPHHRDIFSTQTSAQIDSSVGFTHQTLRGMQVIVEADVWILEDKISVNGWRAMNKIPDDKVSAIKDALYGNSQQHSTWNQSDLKWEVPDNWRIAVGDTYFSGKQYSRMARVALIADELGETESAAVLAGQLKDYLTIWLDRTNLKAQPLMYDKNWGGLQSCGCYYDNCEGQCTPHCDNLHSNGSPTTCPQMTDKGHNFGAGWYNDHHFHYGYFLYAFAVVGKFYPDWLQQYKEHTMLFVRDFASPDTDDAYFPQWRHKDWYAGFSWSSGFPMVYRNGRNQESTSEAVNAYYAVYLYGLALNNTDIQELGLVLSAHEIRGARTYWQIPQSSNVYPRTKSGGYANTRSVVGIMWQNLLQYQTFFGGDSTLVHGIQFLPITPISSLLYPQQWVKEQYDAWSDCSFRDWNVTQICSQAIINQNAAWERAIALPDKFFSVHKPGSNGHSRTNTLYWIATQ